MRPWRPSLGAWAEGGGVRFRVWAPERGRVELVLDDGPPRPLTKQEDGTFTTHVAALPPGARYRYRLDGEGAYPDPASRFQPDGVHGPSEVIDPAAFAWSDEGWRGRPLEEIVAYELHVGTFTPEGTLAAATARLPSLAELGVTAVQVMPLADFPGRWNWGYDGVAPFAPARCYGRPDDFRRLVDRAHALGLAVILDVVYNHFGPDGAHQGAFSPHYFSTRHSTPWGQAVNLDGPHSGPVRSYFFENAAHWVAEYHVDGLRLDATHAFHDESPRHFLDELAERARAAAPDRHVLLVAEDHRNLDVMVRRPEEGGWGLDAEYSDDFHHQVRRRLAGDEEAYFQDFTGDARLLARTLTSGWLFRGERSAYRGRPRGTDPGGIPPRRFVFFLQTHDFVGNRAQGERLHHDVDLAACRAASVLLLCAPETPLLFMGQEWAASTPFLYFTDHHPELGRQVTEGRRREFRHFAAFAGPAARQRIPDPQDARTFARSRLDWEEARREPHAGTLRLHRALLEMRRREPLMGRNAWDGFRADADEDTAIVLRYESAAEAIVVVVQLEGAGEVAVRAPHSWSIALTTEDPAYATDARVVDVAFADGIVRLSFPRPGAVVLRLSAPGGS